METTLLHPLDPHNEQLLQNVHPPQWTNPQPASRYHLVVIGAGTAGLVTAAGAAGLGARVALIERHLLGGDCLNVGCVPSKALIRSARAAAELREAAQFGIHASGGISIDFPAVMERLRRLRAGISHHDSAKRFQSLGVDVFFGQARFADSETIEVEGQRLRFRKAVIATGARAAVPPVDGLVEAGFLTNETVFNLTDQPRRLAVIGGGPIGCELAQAFRRLGSEVFLLHNKAHLLDKEDADAAEVVQKGFIREGVQVFFNSRIQRVENQAQGKLLHFSRADGSEQHVNVDAILVAAGRAPNLDGLNLEAVHVEHDRREGVRVNDYLQTTNPRIYAAGDACLKWKFTHAADATARIVIQNALFLGRKKASALIMPWCTYTDPEIAHVGLSEHEARQQRIAIDPFVRPLDQVDRPIVDGETAGFVKVHVAKSTDDILGATVVARRAGEMISEITVAMAAKLSLGTLANVIHPYPTQAEAIRQTGDAYNRTRLTPFAKKMLGLWLKLAG